MKRPPRFAIASSEVDGGLALVGGAELHHMRHVMRLGPGSEVALFDEHGAEYCGRIGHFDPNQAIIEILSVSKAPRRGAEIIVAPAVIKGPRMDFLVEKAAELGAAELWPILCARGVMHTVGAERLARWRRLATAAAKQSLASGPTEVRPPIAIGDLIRRDKAGRLCVVMSSGAPPLAAMLRRTGPGALLLLSGPEGDFTDEELGAAREAGFVTAGLGPRRLRSETAALAALSIAAEALRESGGET